MGDAALDLPPLSGPTSALSDGGDACAIYGRLSAAAPFGRGPRPLAIAIFYSPAAFARAHPVPAYPALSDISMFP